MAYTLTDKKNDLKGMMKSVYIYETLTKENRWLQSYRKELGEKHFHKTYDDYEKELRKKKVAHDVYTDGEGVTYSALV